ncbi:class I SAM-dependent methyltransferase [Staphylospora marina]|uniref:class I SAM-dependent methyltransferase n=1 Tax=Staphylospora marina TaxID=2490858 RepID=UPI000F5BE9A4|nr:class I SAM-dependent methyltransferase [Staphylospora marina]
MPQWFEKSFGEDYLLVYKHRTRQNASREVDKIVEWLELSGQDLILDLCCGMGRHSIELAKHGYKVVGLDLSRTLLARAVEESRDLPIPFIHGDMRSLPFVDETFDAVINMFTSFGYFDRDEDNLKVLAEIGRVLKPRGRFLIDFLNRDSVVSGLIPVSEREVDGAYIREERHIEGDFVHKSILVRDSDGERKYEERVKMYTADRMMDMLKGSGLVIDKIYGDFQGGPHTPESNRMIFTGWVEK